MQTKKCVIVLIVNVVCWGATVGTYAHGASKPSTMSDPVVCRTMEELLPKAQAGLVWRGQFGSASSALITGVHLTGSVITLKLKEGGKDRDLDIAYNEIEQTSVNYRTAGGEHPCEVIIWKEYKSTRRYDPNKSNRIYDLNQLQATQLSMAFHILMVGTHEGRSFSCPEKRNVEEQNAELAAFEQKTAAWRAMATKPALSDEVTKKRLMAEDAVARKNMNAAVAYYEAGVTIDPTFAQGWYNAAIIHAEQLDYSEAAYCMKHYLILLPNASDAAAAKEKVLLWEAKAEENKTP